MKMGPHPSSSLLYSSSEIPFFFGSLEPQISTLSSALWLIIHAFVSSPCLGSHQGALDPVRLSQHPKPSTPSPRLPWLALSPWGSWLLSQGSMGTARVEMQEGHPSRPHLSHLSWFPPCIPGGLGPA